MRCGKTQNINKAEEKKTADIVRICRTDRFVQLLHARLPNNMQMLPQMCEILIEVSVQTIKEFHHGRRDKQNLLIIIKQREQHTQSACSLHHCSTILVRATTVDSSEPVRAAEQQDITQAKRAAFAVSLRSLSHCSIGEQVRVRGTATAASEPA